MRLILLMCVYTCVECSGLDIKGAVPRTQNVSSSPSQLPESVQVVRSPGERTRPQSSSGGIQRLRKLLAQSEPRSNSSMYKNTTVSVSERERALAQRVNRNIHTRNLISYGSVSGGTTDTQKSKDSIHIAGFFPTSSLANISSEGAIGRGVLPAVKLAIYHINNNNDTLPDYKLHISWNDTKVST